MTFEEWWRAYWYLPINYLGIKYEGAAKDAWDKCHLQWIASLSQTQLIAYLMKKETDGHQGDKSICRSEPKASDS